LREKQMGGAQCGKEGEKQGKALHRLHSEPPRIAVSFYCGAFYHIEYQK
jgi:hypothetical protein